MKKLLCMLLALVMLFALAACGGQTDPGKTDPTKAPVESQKPDDSGKTDPAPSGEPAVLDVALTNAFSGGLLPRAARQHGQRHFRDV